eukprot:592091_1
MCMATFGSVSRKIAQWSSIGVIGTVSISLCKSYYEKKIEHDRVWCKYPLHTFSEFDEFLDQNDNQKLAIIIGGGVVGTSSAFELHKKGFKTAIIDANDDIAKECSYATWGGMSTRYYPVDYSKFLQRHNPHHTTPYNAFHPVYMNWTKILFDLHFLRWTFSFLLHQNWIINKLKSCNLFKDDPQLINTQHNKVNQMTTFVSNAVQYQIDFIKHNQYIPNLKEQCYLNENGVVLIVRNNDQKTCKSLSAKHFDHGIHVMNDAQDTQIYDCSALSLEAIGSVIGNKSLLNALPDADTIKYVQHMRSCLADSPSFCKALKDYLMENGHLQLYGKTKVLDFDIDYKTQKICTIYTNHGLIHVPRSDNVVIVLCTGSWTPNICRKLNLFVPVYPLKGYGLIMDYKPIANVSEHAMIDNHLYYVNYGTINDTMNRIRIASVGAIDGWNTDCNEDIKNEVYAQSKLMLPNLMDMLDDKIDCEQWVVGLRPLTYDTSLIVGQVKEYPNLYMNVGPGYNGFKIAMGSAKLLSDVIVDKDDKSTYFAPRRHNVKKATLFCKISDVFST